MQVNEKIIDRFIKKIGKVKILEGKFSKLAGPYPIRLSNLISVSPTLNSSLVILLLDSEHTQPRFAVCFTLITTPMTPALTVEEKLAFIDEVKEDVLNAFGGGSKGLDSILDEVVGKLKNYAKLGEMTSKKKIEGTFVTYLAMSLASKIAYQKSALDIISNPIPQKPETGDSNRIV